MPSKSIWFENLEPRFPKLEKNIEVDAVIVGGGITGLSVAYYLTNAGVKTAVVEAYTIGSGTTGHTTAHVTSQHDLIYDTYIKRFGLNTAALYAKSNEEAISEIERICHAENIDCDFTRVDSFLFTSRVQNVKKLNNEYEAAKRVGIDAELLQSGTEPFEYLYALKFRYQAMFNPAKYINGLADAIVKKGGLIFEDSRVLHIDKGLIRTQRGSVKAKYMAICTHNPVINYPGMFFAKMYLSRSYAMSFTGTKRIEGMWDSIDIKSHSYRMYGDHLLVSGEGHRCGKKKNDNHYENLESFIKKKFITAHTEYHWSAQDGMTLDGLPYIGKYSKNSEGLYVATGFKKWGMTKSNIAGRIIADDILGIPNPYAKIYSPQRRQVPYAIFNCIYQNVLIAIDLIAGMFRFKSPRCAHFKCGLVWNKDERTWDCPCHGSRFSENGSVLDSPTIHDLKR